MEGFCFVFCLVLLFCFEHYVNGKIFILYSFRDLNANQIKKMKKKKLWLRSPSNKRHLLQIFESSEGESEHLL